jgi:hypothetical protein
VFLCQALGRLREEAHRQARSAIEPLSQMELTQAGKRLLDKVRSANVTSGSQLASFTDADSGIHFATETQTLCLCECLLGWQLRRETSSEYPSLEELRHRFPKAASHMEVRPFNRYHCTHRPLMS